MQHQLKLGYGQFAQDFFVVTLLDHMQNGFFLDVGCGTSDWPADEVPLSTMSNTYGLEKFNNWNGIGIDFDELYCKIASKIRKNIVCADLLQENINTILEENNAPTKMNYLSLDVDEAQRKVLDELDFNKYSFDIITYEHNYSLTVENPNSPYVGDREYSREKFSALGYKILFGNIGLKPGEHIEDWWVTPELYDKWERLAHETITIPELVNVLYEDVMKQEGTK